MVIALWKDETYRDAFARMQGEDIESCLAAVSFNASRFPTTWPPVPPDERNANRANADRVRHAVGELERALAQAGRDIRTWDGEPIGDGVYPHLSSVLMGKSHQAAGAGDDAASEWARAFDPPPFNVDLRDFLAKLRSYTKIWPLYSRAHEAIMSPTGQIPRKVETAAMWSARDALHHFLPRKPYVAPGLPDMHQGFVDAVISAANAILRCHRYKARVNPETARTEVWRYPFERVDAARDQL